MTACEAPLATECQIACEPGQKYYVMGPTKADRIVAWRKPGLWSDGFDSLEYFDSIEAARAVIDKHTRQPRTPGVLTVLDVAGAIRLKASGNEYSADLIRAAEGIEQYGQVRKTPLAALPAGVPDGGGRAAEEQRRSQGRLDRVLGPPPHPTYIRGKGCHGCWLRNNMTGWATGSATGDEVNFPTEADARAAIEAMQIAPPGAKS